MGKQSGVLKNENTIVSSLVSKEEVQVSEINEMVERTFEGSLPAFIAAFGRRESLTAAQIEEIQKIIRG